MALPTAKNFQSLERHANGEKSGGGVGESYVKIEARLRENGASLQGRRGNERAP